MAISSIWIAMTSILTTFNIAKVAGDVEDPNAKKYSGGLITYVQPSLSLSCFCGCDADTVRLGRYPLPFKADLKVRSESAAEAIRATEHNE